MEDLDGPRCKPQFYTAMYQAILWFGVQWTAGPEYTGEKWEIAEAHRREDEIPCGSLLDVGPYLQSQRLDLYRHAWKILYEKGCIYPSNVSRKKIEQSLSAPHEGEGEVVFPASLRCPVEDMPKGLTEPDGQSWRFRVPDGETIRFTDQHMGFREYTAGTDFGDFLVWRFDGFPSYEMAVVIDDIAMGITEIVRGEDLLLSTARQILLYKAFGISADNLPDFFHSPLVRDPETGKRLAKRDGARSLRTLQENGWTPEMLREKLCCFDGVVL